MFLGTDLSRYTAIQDAQFALGGRYYRNQVHQVALRAYAAVATPEIPAENQAIPGTGHRQLDRGRDCMRAGRKAHIPTLRGFGEGKHRDGSISRRSSADAARAGLLLPVCRHKTRRGYVVFGLSPSNTYGMTKR